MYYEEPVRRKKTHRIRNWIIKQILKLLLICVIIIALVIAVLYVAPVSVYMLDTPQADSINTTLPLSRMNILLLGTDQLSSGMQRSDTMMILSVGENDIALTSLMRDMQVNISGHGKQRINAAFAYGGADLAIRTVNESFRMNITKYVTIDYMGFLHLVDALGGVEISVTEKEKERLNYNLTRYKDLLEEKGFMVTPLEAAGENVQLNGLQALAFARIRKIDSDYNRTGRQRQLIDAILKKIKKKFISPATIGALYKVYQEDVRTNLNWLEILGIGIKVLKADNKVNHRLPADGTYKDTGSVLVIDQEKNADALYGWLYGAEN